MSPCAGKNVRNLYLQRDPSDKFVIPLSSGARPHFALT